MSAESLTPSSSVEALIRSCRARIRWVSAVSGLLESILTILIFLTVSCLLDWLFPLSAVFRCLLLAALALLCLECAWRRCVRRLVEKIPSDEIAAMLDLSDPELHEGVSSLLSFSSSSADSSSKPIAPVFVRSIVKNLESRLRHVRIADVISVRPLIRRVIFLFVIVLISLTASLIWKEETRLLLKRLILPFSNLETVAGFGFEVIPGDSVAARGTPLTVTAKPVWRNGRAGELPKDVYLELRGSEGRTDRLRMLCRENSSDFQAVIPDLQDSVDYRIDSEIVTSRWFHLGVEDSPEIQSAVLSVVPPVYTEQKPFTVEGMVGQMEVFEGSELRIQLSFSKPVRRADLRWKSSNSQPLPSAEELKVSTDGRSAEYVMSAVGSGDFEFRIEDTSALPNLHEPERSLVAIVDLPPVLEVTGIRDGVELRPDGILALDCSASDDIGVKKLELHLQRNNEDAFVVAGPAPETNERNVEHSFRYSLRDLKLNTRDTVVVKICAVDGCPKPEPHVVWKGPWVISVKSDAAAPGTSELREENQRLQAELKAIDEQLQAAEKQAQKLSQQEWNQTAATEAGAVGEKLQLLGGQLGRVGEQVAQHPLMKQPSNDIQRLGKELKTDIGPQVNSAAKSEEGRKAAEGIQEAAASVEDIRRQLSQARDSIGKISETEEQLAELSQIALEAERLAEESRQMQGHEQPPSGSSESSAAKRKEQIAADQQRVENALNDLLRRQEELRRAAQQSQLDELNEVAEKAASIADAENRLAAAVKDSPPAESNGSNVAEQQAPAKGSESSDRELEAARTLMKRLSELAQSHRRMMTADDADDRKADNGRTDGQKEESGPEAEAMNASVEHAENAIDAAESGAFRDAAKELRSASRSGQQAFDAMTKASEVDAGGQPGAADASGKDSRPDKTGPPNEASEKKASDLSGSAESGGAQESRSDVARRLNRLAQEYASLANSLEELQNRPSVRRQLQSEQQERISDAASSLPDRFRDLSERMRLPSLGMNTEAEQSASAGQTAGEGSEKAGESLGAFQSEELAKAADSAQQAAEKFQSASEQASRIGESAQSNDSVIPSEVGQSVVGALQNLSVAAKNIREQQSEMSAAENGSADSKASAGQQASADGAGASAGEPGAEADSEGSESGGGSPSDRQRDDGQSGGEGGSEQTADSLSQQLSQAAGRLQEAAGKSLPQSALPGRMTESQTSGTSGDSGTGQDAPWDGRSPRRSDRSGKRARSWGQLQDRLNDSIQDGGQEFIDPEYSEQIRRYRRALAQDRTSSTSTSQDSTVLEKGR
ncbi:MAG: hypothetical protein ACK526_09715 [Planctomyces sp.]